MSLQDLKNNISQGKKIITELRKLEKNLKYADQKEKQFYSSTINSLYERLRIITSAIPSILTDISAAKKLDVQEERKYSNAKDIAKFSYVDSRKNEKNFITIKKEDKEKFVKELNISDVGLKKIVPSGESVVEKPSLMAKISNNVFGNLSEKIAHAGWEDLKKDLRESNSRFLLSTYISIAIFCTVSTFLLGLIFAVISFIFFPGSFFLILIPILIPIFTLIGFYLYPSIEKTNIDKEINNELPFATIYMAAIAGSNIEPTKIFKIIANSPEYKHVGLEIRKVINQVEIYGYDLVNALKNVAKSTPNKKLEELLNGLAGNIVSGGSLKDYLEKRSENLLTDYKLERERYNSVAGTFMDVYISVLITAPLILVMLIVIMGITNLNLGRLSTQAMVVLSIGLVVLINIIFLIFLQIRQPKV